MDSKLLLFYFMFIIMFMIKFKHFLMTLISIELLMFTTISLLLYVLKSINSDFFMIFFLVIMVSESVMGLSLMILMSRIYNNDSTSVMILLW